jgi:hypothetical protein
MLFQQTRRSGTVRGGSIVQVPEQVATTGDLAQPTHCYREHEGHDRLIPFVLDQANANFWEAGETREMASRIATNVATRR